MAYNEDLAERVRAIIGDDPRLSERKMFGGLCLMLDGNMCLGVVGDDLMVRVGPDEWGGALGWPHARKMDFTGKVMKSMVFVDAAGTNTDPELEQWVDRSITFASTLPPKR